MTYADARFMLTYADACCMRRMLTYADVCRRMPTYADICDVCYRMNIESTEALAELVKIVTYADVCRRMLTYATG
jgi:hypothetical protein